MARVRMVGQPRRARAKSKWWATLLLSHFLDSPKELESESWATLKTITWEGVYESTFPPLQSFPLSPPPAVYALWRVPQTCRPLVVPPPASAYLINGAGLAPPIASCDMPCWCLRGRWGIESHPSFLTGRP